MHDVHKNRMLYTRLTGNCSWTRIMYAGLGIHALTRSSGNSLYVYTLYYTTAHDTAC